MAIKNVGVLGCGLMGSGIAEVCARAGYETVVREVSQELLEKGLGRIQRLARARRWRRASSTPRSATRPSAG